MIDVHCPRHRSRVLLWPSNLDSVTEAGDGFLVGWHCHCGARGTTFVARAADRRIVP